MVSLGTALEDVTSTAETCRRINHEAKLRRLEHFLLLLRDVWRAGATEASLNYRCRFDSAARRPKCTKDSITRGGHQRAEKGSKS